MNNYGINVSGYVNDRNKCCKLLAKFLNKGHMGLFLGAGASSAVGLPSWEKLVKAICLERWSGFDIVSSYTTEELKTHISNVKADYNNDDIYLEAVQRNLYKGVDFDFTLARKELLIALSSLLIGAHHGKVENIVTLNFDSVMEWYLQMLGLRVNILSKDQLLHHASDVSITHINGYLPHNSTYGENSDFLIFSEEDFQNRSFSPYDYWKDYLIEFFRRHIFLSVGMSCSSLIYDVRPYLTRLDQWYEIQKIERLKPYGFAFVSTDSTDEEIAKLTKMGVVACRFEHNEIPPALFDILNHAVS